MSLPLVEGIKYKRGIDVMPSSCSSALFSFSFKSPGRPDGVNYIRTDEEVRSEGTVPGETPDSRGPQQGKGHPSLETKWVPQKKDSQVTFQALGSPALPSTRARRRPYICGHLRCL